MKPKVSPRVFAPSQRGSGAAAGATRKQASDPLPSEGEEEEEDYDEEEDEEEMQVASSSSEGCSAADAAAGRRLLALQEETGYHVLASMELEPVLDAFLSHMVPFEREEVCGLTGVGMVFFFSFFPVFWNGFVDGNPNQSRDTHHKKKHTHARS